MRSHSNVRIALPPAVAAVGAALGISVLVAVPRSVAGAHSYITHFSKTANDQTNLQWTFPVGPFVATNTFATPFQVTADENGRNFAEIYNKGSRLVISNLDLPNVTTVFTIMNAYTPVAGSLASIEFIGSAGADQIFILSGGVHLRDFFQGSWQNTLNGTTAQMAYQITNVRGAAGTGNSSTGLVGTYRLDEQKFVLTNLFLIQNLQSIVISNVSSQSTPFVVALTAQQLNPVLDIQPVSGGGVTLSWPANSGGFRLEENAILGSTNWQPNTNPIILVNGTNEVTIVPAISNRFFRLIFP